MILNLAFEELSKENILKYIDEVDIYKRYLSDEIIIGKKYNSPYRKDKHPSFSFFVNDNNILWKDFGDPDKPNSGDAFLLVSKIYSCSFREALNIINNDFNLHLNSFTETLRPKRIVMSTKKEKLLKTAKNGYRIDFNRRLFNEVDKQYWNSYSISLNTLSFYDVIPASRIWIDNILFYSYSSTNPGYVYKIKNGEKKCFKILFPFAKKEFKWRSNCLRGFLQGYSQLQYNNDLLIITKSLKDVMLLYQLDYESIAPQSEISTFIEEKLFKTLIDKYKKILIFFDNDEQGMSTMGQIQKEYGFDYIFIPKEYNAKDISDFAKMYSLEKTESLMKNLIKQYV